MNETYDIYYIKNKELADKLLSFLKNTYPYHSTYLKLDESDFGHILCIDCPYSINPGALQHISHSCADFINAWFLDEFHPL